MKTNIEEIKKRYDFVYRETVTAESLMTTELERVVDELCALLGKKIVKTEAFSHGGVEKKIYIDLEDL